MLLGIIICMVAEVGHLATSSAPAVPQYSASGAYFPPAVPTFPPAVPDQYSGYGPVDPLPSDVLARE